MFMICLLHNKEDDLTAQKVNKMCLYDALTCDIRQ